MKRQLAGLAGAGLVLVFASGCGPGAAAPSGNATPGPTQGTAQVTPDGQIAADACTPGPIEGAQESRITGTHEWAPTDFTLAIGESITWFNDSTLGHTVTFDSGPDCDYVVVNGSVSVTFNTPGVFTFLCRIYPSYMKGTVIVL